MDERNNALKIYSYCNDMVFLVAWELIKQSYFFNNNNIECSNLFFKHATSSHIFTLLVIFWGKNKTHRRTNSCGASQRQLINAITTWTWTALQVHIIPLLNMSTPGRPGPEPNHAPSLPHSIHHPFTTTTQGRHHHQQQHQRQYIR